MKWIKDVLFCALIATITGFFYETNEQRIEAKKMGWMGRYKNFRKQSREAK